MKIEINNVEEFIKEIQDNTEYLDTITGDEIECISVENLTGILDKYTIK